MTYNTVNELLDIVCQLCSHMLLFLLLLYDEKIIKMTDIHSQEVRSYNMSRIRGKNTKPEVLVRKFLFSRGFRYRLNVKSLPGKPDLVLKRYKTVIFINGCFWHGHENCKYFVLPKTRPEWWKNKIEQTKKRDYINKKALVEMGWNVLSIWECQLKSDRKNETLQGVVNLLSKTFLDQYKK